jgi:hypothetical protein
MLTEVAGPYATSPVWTGNFATYMAMGAAQRRPYSVPPVAGARLKQGYGSAACAAPVRVPVISRCARLNVRY